MHGDVLTVTGRTMAENLADIAPPDVDGNIIRAMDRPIHKTGGLTILKGSLAPEGAVVKSAGFDDSTFTGTARVFDGERAALDALTAGQIVAGDVVVIRYEGPKGGPGMREMLAITGAIKGAGLGKDVLLITDGRFSGGTTGALRRTHRAGGRRRRADRVPARRRQDHARRRQPHARRGDPRPRRPSRGLVAEPAEVHPRCARQVRQGRPERRPRRGLRLGAGADVRAGSRQSGPRSCSW